MTLLKIAISYAKMWIYSRSRPCYCKIRDFLTKINVIVKIRKAKETTFDNIILIEGLSVRKKRCHMIKWVISFWKELPVGFKEKVSFDHTSVLICYIPEKKRTSNFLDMDRYITMHFRNENRCILFSLSFLWVIFLIDSKLLGMCL